MTIIDTNVMIPFLKGTPEAVNKVHEVSNKSHVLITVITAYELLKGARLSSKPQENLEDVKKAISNMQVLDFSIEACEEASSIFCELKKSGKMISEFDILIAAIAKTNGEAILSQDQHFNSIKGIDLIHILMVGLDDNVGPNPRRLQLTYNLKQPFTLAYVIKRSKNNHKKAIKHLNLEEQTAHLKPHLFRNV